MTNLQSTLLHDGSRLFWTCPEGNDFSHCRGHVRRLAGAEITNYLTDDVTEVWIDFVFRGHAFTINNQFGEYWFFVADPTCADEDLLDVIAHFKTMSCIL